MRKIEQSFVYNGRNMTDIEASIEDEVREEILGDIEDEEELEAREADVEEEIARRMEENRTDILRIANLRRNVARVIDLLERSIGFLQALANGISKGLEGAAYRQFIVAAAKNAFKLGKRESGQLLRFGFEESAPTDRVELAGQLAGQRQPAPAAPAAPAQRQRQPEMGDDINDFMIAPPRIRRAAAAAEEEEAPGGAAARQFAVGVPQVADGVNLADADPMYYFQVFTPVWQRIPAANVRSLRGRLRDNINTRNMNARRAMEDIVGEVNRRFGEE
jgi:pyruvate/2-oxoglutarate dehydrogenase complex dihydrolipoamide acyltransferase (E2) component